MTPDISEPPFPVNITSWRHYTCVRLLALTVLALSLFRLAETGYVTTARIDGIRAEAEAALESRGAAAKTLDSSGRFWLGRPPERVLVARKANAIVCGRRLRSAAGVALAWCLVWVAFRSRGA